MSCIPLRVTFLIALLAAMLHLAPASFGAARADESAAVAKVLDDWHAAAARADESAYFSHFTPDAIFMGTDATEYWTVAQFREYAHPHFAKGKAWTFNAKNRHVYFSPDRKTAWFDEALDTPHMGECRGSGVLLLNAATWKIAHYNLTVPIPNDLMKDFVARIAEFGAAAPAGAGSPDASRVLRVMSFNIRYANSGDGDDRWDLRRNDVATFLRTGPWDVVGLQEALRSQLDDLAKALPEMGELGVGRDDGKTKGEYVAILYKKDRWRPVEHGTFWLSDTPEVPGSKSWGNNITRICTWARFEPIAAGAAAGSFYLYNVHLDHQSQESRERSVQLLLERIAARTSKDPVVITGDFNAGEDNRAVQVMKQGGTGPDGAKIGCLDTFRAIYPGEQVVGTFNGFKGRTDGPKIDYVFIENVPNGLRVRSAAIHREIRPAPPGRQPGDVRNLSDHFPVSAVLELPAK